MAGPHPAIVGLHPASDGSREHFLLRHLAQVLPPLGMAVGRFDRRGDDVPLDDQVTVPVLLFYGEDDEWQPIDRSVAAWRRAAASAGNGGVTVLRLLGTGHAPTCGGRDAIDAVAPEYESALVDWLGRVVG